MPVQITGVRRPENGPRPRICRKSFGLSRLYRYLLILQIKSFRSTPSHSATKSQSFRFGVKLFSRFAHAWGREGGQNVFSPGFEPSLGDPSHSYCQ